MDLITALAARGPSRKVSRLSDLTAERAKELLDYDPETGVFRWKVSKGRVKAGDVAGRVNNTGYIQIRVDRNLYQAHRIAWLLTRDEWPNLQIDHINGDRADNRICNLRQATKAQNAQNTSKRAHNTSGFKGVSWCRRHAKWHAQLQKNKRRVYLGRFRCPTAAHIAYCKAAKEHFGEYARTD